MGKIEQKFNRSLNTAANADNFVKSTTDFLENPGSLDGELTPQEEQQLWQLVEREKREFRQVLKESWSNNVN